MKIVYDNGDVVRLRRVEQLDTSIWMIEEDQYGDTFVVVREVDDGYFDIECERTGQTYDAVSTYHLFPASSSWKKDLDLVDL